MKRSKSISCDIPKDSVYLFVITLGEHTLVLTDGHFCVTANWLCLKGDHYNTDSTK